MSDAVKRMELDAEWLNGFGAGVCLGVVLALAGMVIVMVVL